MLKQNRNALTNLTNRYRAVLRRCRLRALALACALTVLPPLPAGANSGGEEGTDEWDLPAYIGSTTGSGGHVIIDSGFEGFVYGGYTTAPGTDATGNTVRLTNGTVTKDVYGGLSKYGNAHNNTVIISGGTMRAVWGGDGASGATHNTVIISGGTVTWDVWGGIAQYGSANGNTAIISGGTMRAVWGGDGASGATHNTVIISGGTMKAVCGGDGVSGATNNTVIISGGTVTGVVHGGYTADGGATNNTVIISGGTVGDVRGGNGGNGIATGNRVILSGAPTLTGLISGGENLSTGDVVSGNLLELRSSGLQAVNIKNFEQYAFHMPADIRPGAVLLTLGEDPYVPSAMYVTDLTNFGKSLSPVFRRIDVDGAASPLRVGDKVTLFRNDNGLTPGTLPTSVSGTQGVTL
ncbi:MAG TPA: carbohydrate-binding domain-containing protein, partial [Candidatus Desulfovibrio intestinavium]|nr:carbohydrate-binding domain-containing protein [Candidatus Desulfovibrio intestinavium]